MISRIRLQRMICVVFLLMSPVYLSAEETPAPQEKPAADTDKAAVDKPDAKADKKPDKQKASKKGEKKTEKKKLTPEEEAAAKAKAALEASEKELDKIETTDKAVLAPEFGSSIMFDRDDPRVMLRHLRGKGVYIMFWRKMKPGKGGGKAVMENKKVMESTLKQITQKFRNRRDIVVMVIRVDGNAKTMKDMFKLYKIDPSGVYIAEDKNGAYYSFISGKSVRDLTHHADFMIDQRGKLCKSYSLFNNRTIIRHPVLTGKGYAINDKSLAKAVKAAEVRDFALAIREAKRATRNRKIQTDANALFAEIKAIIEKTIADNEKILADTNSPDRFKAFQTLLDLEETLPRREYGKRIQVILKTVKKDKAIKNELKAKTIYNSMLAPLLSKPVNKSAAKSAINNLGYFVKRFPDSYFRTAAEASMTILKNHVK